MHLVGAGTNPEVCRHWGGTTYMRQQISKAQSQDSTKHVKKQATLKTTHQKWTVTGTRAKVWNPGSESKNLATVWLLLQVLLLLKRRVNKLSRLSRSTCGERHCGIYFHFLDLLFLHLCMGVFRVSPWFALMLPRRRNIQGGRGSSPVESISSNGCHICGCFVEWSCLVKYCLYLLNTDGCFLIVSGQLQSSVLPICRKSIKSVQCITIFPSYSMGIIFPNS